MEKLDKTVGQYLTMHTNYALLISGDWGSGKTYYYKNILQEKIKDTPTIENNSKKYKPILISLFGLKTIKEVQSEIFLSIFQYLKDEKIKLGFGITKSLIRGLMALKGFEEVYDSLKEIDFDKGEWINYNDLVICFDDLERISPKLKIKEIIGFINLLIENENAKIIIIANENNIPKKHYLEYKEKIIGNSIEFIPDLNKTFDNIVSDRYNASKSYKFFLQNNKDLIISLFNKKQTKNLRTLIFCLDYFQFIFSEVTLNIITNKELETLKNEILIKLFNFTIAISIEYKEGKISFKNREGIEYDNITSVLLLDKMLENKQQFRNEKQEDKKDRYIEKFINTYYDNSHQYFFFESIYNYITGGDIITKNDKLSIEITNAFHLNHNKILPQYDVFNKLSNSYCFNLTNMKYKTLCREMLEYCDNGEYELVDYLTIFYFITRFDNPLHYDLKLLEKRIIKGMNKGKLNYKHIPQLEHQLFRFDSNEVILNLYSNIKNETLMINSGLYSREEMKLIEESEKLFYENIYEFYKKVLQINDRTYYSNLFKYFNINKLYSFLLNAENDKLWTFNNFIYQRYNTQNPSLSKEELPNLEKLKDKLNRSKSIASKKVVTGIIYKEIIKQLDIVIKRLKE